MVLVSGYKVYPREIEERLHEHPAIREAAVVGIPDTYRGNTLKAWVAFKAGQCASEAELDNYCRENLAPYKVPRVYAFMDELPKTTVGKIDKRKLRDEAALDNIEFAYEAGLFDRIWMTRCPMFRDLRHEPRFRGLRRKVSERADRESRDR